MWKRASGRPAVWAHMPATKRIKGHRSVTLKPCLVMWSSGITFFPRCLSGATHVAPRDLSCELSVDTHVV